MPRRASIIEREIRSGIELRDVRDPGIIWSADFRLLPLSTSTNAAEIRAAVARMMGIPFTRPSAATAQTSASTVVASGIGADDPRIADLGNGRGLLIEPARTNLILQSRDRANVAYTAGTGVVTDGYAISADGSTLVDRQVCASGQFGHYQSPTSAMGVATNTSYVLSQWARRGVLGVASSVGMYLQENVLITSSSRALDDDAWKRLVNPTLTTGGAATGLIASLCDGRTVNGLTAAARDAVVDFAQVEAGKFPTSAIITSGAAATRAADRVSKSAASLVRNGRLALELRTILLGALPVDYQTAGSWVFANDAIGDGVYVSNTSNIITVSGGTVIASSNTITAANAFDVLDVYAEIGNGTPYVAVRTNNGPRTVMAFSGTQGAAATANVIDFLQASGANGLSGVLQYVNAYTPGKRPAWVA